MTDAELAALPGPMAATALPDGPGIVHTPTGPSIFDRPRAERAFVVGPAAVPTVGAEPAPNLALVPGQLVAGAVADGHGVLLGWRGEGQLTRGDLLRALDAIGMAGAAPEATSARPGWPGRRCAQRNRLHRPHRAARFGPPSASRAGPSAARTTPATSARSSAPRC